jgi:NHLM bacteriocin system ABC transporter ATP-binding protein
MMTTSTIAAPPRPLTALFEAEGSPVAAGGRAFLLAGENAWLVAAGRVDLFAVRLEDGRPAGPRRHLARVEEGEPLLALGDLPRGAAVGLLAVGSAGTRLLALPQARLKAYLSDPDRAPAVRRALARWVSTLCAAVVRGQAPRTAGELPSGAVVTLAAGESVGPRGPVWVRASSGRVLLAGAPHLALEPGALIPLAPPAWLTAEGDAVLEGEPTLSPDEAWRGVGRLHRLALAAAAGEEERQARAERERARRRAEVDRAALARACGRLVGVLEGDAAVPAASVRAAGPGEDSTVAAARLVGEAMGIAVRHPGVGGNLRAVARASRFHIRRVVLRDAWWGEDAGPLLAYTEEGKRPVALLPVRGRRYLLCDPAAGTRLPVDGKVAGTLSPFAWAFYRPFEAKELRLLDVLRFGVRGCGRDAAAVLGMGAAGALLALAPPIATGLLFNAVIPGAERGQLVQLTLVLLAAAVAAGLFHLTRAVALTRIEGKMGSAVQAAVWDRLLSLPPNFFRSFSAGELASRAMGVDALRQALSAAAATGLIGIVFALFQFALLVRYSPRLAVWAALLASVAIAATFTASVLQLRRQRVLARMQSELEGLVLQFLTGIAKLRAAAAEARAFARWADRFAEMRGVRYGVRRIGIALSSFQAGFPVAASVVVFAAAAQAVGPGPEGLRTGDFLAFLAAFGAFTGALLSTSGAVVAALAALPQFENARPILQTLPEVDAVKAHPGTLRGEIEVRHVHFRYAPDGPWTLENLSLTMGAGEFVALVGPSGSGKSTLLRLLLGFEKPEAGSIFFDGQDLAGLDVGAVRRQIGVVLQNGRLMPGDLYTNIVGSSGASLDDAWEAARMAGLDADIKAMPMGMHTVVSEGAGTLSGGQRQRLMIARAVVGRPRILFFDEATSALDNRTQAIVSDALAQLRATRVVIAHRLSTVVHADRICVVQAGRLVQQGKYEELMEQDGPFKELALRQIA